MNMENKARQILEHYVTGAIERGEAEAIYAVDYDSMTESQLIYAADLAQYHANQSRGYGDFELAARYSTEAVNAYKTLAQRRGAYC